MTEVAVEASLRRMRLLLIEDDEDDYLLTREYLEDVFGDQFRLDWASDEGQALDWISANHHDLCLMDIHLGSTDGIQLLRKARQLGFVAPIIMLTGQEDLETDAMARNAGATDYLSKQNLEGRTLARAIRYALSRRDMEFERLERTRVEAESRAKTDFLARLSHELRTPLAAILGYTDLLLAEPVEKRTDEHLLTIQRNGMHLRSLLNDVIDLSKIESGKLDIEPTRLDFELFLAELTGMMSMPAEEKGLALELQMPPSLPSELYTDPVRLRQILINLLGNAIKYSEQGVVTLKLYTRKSDGPEQTPLLVFEVRDQGPGISGDDLVRLFEPFTRLENAATTEGTGLGLSISKQLTQRLGGDIEVESTPGQGSAFRLVFPVGNIAADSVWSQLEPASRQPRSRVGAEPLHLEGHVLIVEDNHSLRRLLKLWLEKLDLRVSEARNGAAALEYLQEVTASGDPGALPDLVLMDVQMPVLDGLSTTRKLREMGFRQPIIALTAAVMKGERERVMAGGCNGFLGKPVTPEQLARELRRHLSRKTEKPQEKALVEKTASARRLLLVEDSADLALATAQLLGSLGWEVQVAGTGKEALLRGERFNPDLILLDMQLPDMNGREVARALRSRLPESTRLIALTGDTLDLDDLASLGIEQLLTKPVDLDMLKSLA